MPRNIKLRPTRHYDSSVLLINKINETTHWFFLEMRLFISSIWVCMWSTCFFTCTWWCECSYFNCSREFLTFSCSALRTVWLLRSFLNVSKLKSCLYSVDKGEIISSYYRTYSWGRFSFFSSGNKCSPFSSSFGSLIAKLIVLGTS